MVMNKKNFFLIVGVSKSGTTSLGSYLSQHPNIYVPSKINEPKFFVKDNIKSISKFDPIKNSIFSRSILNKKEYFQLFEQKEPIKYFGEDSIHYFNHPNESIKNIKKYVGDIPIFIIMRNPVDRMISNWKYIKRDFLPFNTALKFEKQRKEIGYNSFWLYKQQSFYYDKVKYFKDNFSKVHIVLFDDFVSNTNKSLNECLNFLNLNNYEFDVSNIINKTGNNMYIDNKFFLKILENFTVYKFCSNFINYFNLDRLGFFFKPKQDIFIDRANFISLFKEDINKLENLIDKDLSNWKN
tara:strand:- start:988 stop:1875 length:888 start_codon:yes stop_codon:yes gene_type:complete